MKTIIVGPGAVGTLLGGLLRLSGHDITLVGRGGPRPSKKTGRAARTRRIRLILPSQWLTAQDVTLAGPEGVPHNAEAWIVTLGRHHLHAMRRPDFARITKDGGGPVFLFNADPTEAERLALAPQRRRFGLTLLTAARLQEGEAELTGAEAAVIVEKGPGTEELFRGLEAYGISVLSADDILPFMNSFFVRQLLLLPVALCNLTLPAFLAAPEGRELALAIMQEGFLTMEKLGLPLAALPALDPRALSLRILKKPGSFDAARETPDRSYNTVLQAYLAEKPVEAAFFNRRLVEMASSTGLHLTWNWRVMQKAGRVSSVGFYRGPEELLGSLE